MSGELAVAAFLGPYRNLTTLTASVLALHPHAQVLNHAGRRLFADPELDFVRDPRPATFARFCTAAIAESRGGRRGMHGGAITHSHAFDSPALRSAYRGRFGTATRRRRIRALVWKDSLVLTRAIQRSGVDVRALLEGAPGLRFLVPVRFPLDCAASCIANGHAGLLSRDDRSLVGVLDGVLRELRWARELEQAWPQHVFLFWEHDIGPPVLEGLARFLALDLERRWLADATRCFVVKRSYDHASSVKDHYVARVNAMFADDRAFARQLERFVTATVSESAT